MTRQVLPPDPETPAPEAVSPKLKALCEFGPLAVFFAVFYLYRGHPVTLWGQSYDGMVLATLVFIPVMVLATLVLWRASGRLSMLQLVSLGLVVVMGGATVWLNDERFFKMKPTLLYALMGGLLAVAAMLQRPWLRVVLGSAIPMTLRGWQIFTWRTAGFFFALAVLNEVVWRNFSDGFWVNFKIFGLTALSVVFIIANNGLFQRHALDPEAGDHDA